MNNEQAIKILRQCIDIATGNGGFKSSQEPAAATMAINTLEGFIKQVEQLNSPKEEKEIKPTPKKSK